MRNSKISDLSESSKISALIKVIELDTEKKQKLSTDFCQLDFCTQKKVVLKPKTVFNCCPTIRFPTFQNTEKKHKLSTHFCQLGFCTEKNDFFSGRKSRLFKKEVNFFTGKCFSKKIFCFDKVYFFEENQDLFLGKVVFFLRGKSAFSKTKT